MGVTPDNIVSTLWKREDLLTGVLSLLSIERILLPWVSEHPGKMNWDRRDMLGFVIASWAPRSAYIRGQSTTQIFQSKEEMDVYLHKQNWILIDPPPVLDWESTAVGAWHRKTVTDTVVVSLQKDQRAEEPTYWLQTIFDDTPIKFHGTLTQAKQTLNQQLLAHGFISHMRHYRCMGCGAMDEELDDECILQGGNHKVCEVTENGDPV